MSENRVLAWHFLPDDGKIQHGYGKVALVGETYSVEGPIEMCRNGLHGSERILDALLYAPGSVLSRVEMWGDLRCDSDKLCARYRRVIAIGSVDSTLHEFACKVAAHALNRANVADERCWAAIQAKRRWLRGEIGDGELAAAWDAARAAAWDAARDAARAAARDAAWAAAWDVARAAARAAAGDAAWDAARAAAGDAQNRLLRVMVKGALRCE